MAPDERRMPENPAASIWPASIASLVKIEFAAKGGHGQRHEEGCFQHADQRSIVGQVGRMIRSSAYEAKLAEAG